MFMDAADGWDLDVSLSEQENSTMLIMFMDATIGWVLDVSLSEQKTCAIYVDNCERINHTLGLFIACLFIQELQS
jgi:hypothetical protein